MFCQSLLVEAWLKQSKVLCIAILAEWQYLKIISLDEHLKKRSPRNTQLCSQDNAEADAIERVEYKNPLNRSAKQIAFLVCHICESGNAAIARSPTLSFKRTPKSQALTLFFIWSQAMIDGWQLLRI
ncbi:hypothetical protein [Microcoleus sp. AT3-D2]|uniref:hypothetical protein n=1 Tax=Microcoleus sp. AT3-D2 TaxID=2818612 RepID=UPI002FCEAEA3